MHKENRSSIDKISSVTQIPTQYGSFECFSFSMQNDSKEHFVLMNNIKTKETPFVRIHSECLTGDIFGSLKCDCGEQLKKSLKLISKNGGIFIYLRQEGRGIGLVNKMNVYKLQEEGYDTADANLKMGHLEDERTYEAAVSILDYLEVKQIKLLTNNPIKLKALKEKWGNKVTRIEISTVLNSYNKKYIQTKIKKFDHLIKEIL